MELKDIIAKLEEKEIDSGIVDAVKNLDQTAEVERLKGELESEQGKTAGILADKKKFKERAEEAEKKIAEAEKAKLPEDERHKQELQELKDKLDAEKAEREKQAEEFAQTQRTAKLADITGSVKWASSTPHDTAKLIIKNALADVDDLSDQSKVDEILNAVKESHKSFIAADAASGSGGKGGGGAPPSDKSPSIADNQKAIWGDK